MKPGERWHLTHPQLADYASGRTTLARAASVEAHLTACDDCRSMLNGMVPELPTDRMWQQILAKVDAPASGRYRRAVEQLQKRSRPTTFHAGTLRTRLAGIAAVALMLGLALPGPQPSARPVQSARSVTDPAGAPGLVAPAEGRHPVRRDDTVGRLPPRATPPGPPSGSHVPRNVAHTPAVRLPTVPPTVEIERRTGNYVPWTAGRRAA